MDGIDYGIDLVGSVSPTNLVGYSLGRHLD